MAHLLGSVLLAATAALAGAAGHLPVWDDLAACESGGVWDADTGNGFYGGLQIQQPTWEEHGGAAFAPRPDLAPPDDQITVAEDILGDQGWEAWPDCSRRLGLSGRWHAVRPGETLQSIADQHQVPGGPEELQGLNPGLTGPGAPGGLTPGTLVRLP